MTDEPITQHKMDQALSNRLPYPGELMKQVYRAPILFWRLGFGPMMGKLVLILSHIGRRSGKVRHTALEYHRFEGRIYVFSGWSRSDWFKNIQAEPRVTLQTDQGEQHALARVLQSNSEYYEAHRLIEKNPLVRAELAAAGVDTALAAFLENKNRIQIVTFDATNLPTPPPLQTDLNWVSPVMLGIFGMGYLAGKQIPRRKRRWF